MPLTGHAVHDRTQYQIELAGDSATVYLFEQLGTDGESSLATLCRDLPAHVRILRVDARGLGMMTSGAMHTVRALFAAWQERREGQCILRGSYLVASWRQLESAA